MNARELDPSMVLGFYCRTRADFDSLCLELELLATRAGSTPILTVAPGPPPWDSDSDAERRDGGAGSDDDWELV
jgi:cysteine protease ATG4